MSDFLDGRKQIQKTWIRLPLKHVEFPRSYLIKPLFSKPGDVYACIRVLIAKYVLEGTSLQLPQTFFAIKVSPYL